MAKNNLAHYEQILKSFEQSLKEICDQHQQADNALIELEKYYNFAKERLSSSWTDVLHLFVKIDQLRSIKLKLEKED